MTTIMNGALMIARASRAFPGMVMSLALSVPVISGHAWAAAEPAETTTSAPHRTEDPRKTSHPAVAKGVAATPTAARSAASTTPKPPSRMRFVRPDRTPGRGTIYRTESHGTVVIDDATLWREPSSMATWQQTGVASWYGGSRWQGNRTTSGARYDQNALTAAHATLPIGTRVRVTLNDNAARSVIVTINDRPGTRSRIIDLSRQAAADLGILQRGVAMVTLTPL
jgi:rare lipoprotein A (peptidoglycan hydrolase)